MNLRKLVFAAILSSVAAFAQPAATLDTTYQIRYASNLQATGGDSYINISNTGQTAAGIASGTTPVVTGTICANVYAFGPDEEILSCCSCPVTPNGLVSLSAKNDLMNNILGRFTPNSIVIKLVATAPTSVTATGCANTASSVGVAGTVLASGMVAWGTTLHANTAPLDAGHFGLTETAFTPSVLSAGEATRLGSLCNFAQLQGSLHGICNTCSVGGLGAAAQ